MGGGVLTNVLAVLCEQIACALVGERGTVSAVCRLWCGEEDRAMLTRGEGQPRGVLEVGEIHLVRHLEKG